MTDLPEEYQAKNAEVRPPAVEIKAEFPAPRVGIRSYFSTHFLAAAEDSAVKAKEVEQRFINEGDKRFSLSHRSLVLSAVVHSVAFMEGAINEVLQDAAEGHMTEKLSQVDADAIRAWAGLWVALGFGGTGRAIARYQAALIAAACDPFDTGAEPWQSAQLLVRLRNHLVHYTPETVFADSPPGLADGLRSSVGANPLSSNDWDVDGWLSADCANWAVNSAVALVEEFATRTGAVPNYQLALKALREDNP